jgi:hypothetical protein
MNKYQEWLKLLSYLIERRHHGRTYEDNLSGMGINFQLGTDRAVAYTYLEITKDKVRRNRTKWKSLRKNGLDKRSQTRYHTRKIGA